jgi:undecaprenyl-diphosphatase
VAHVLRHEHRTSPAVAVAAAFAFGSGVAQEQPAFGAALAPVAVATAAALRRGRVASRRSPDRSPVGLDTVSGAALGVAAGLVSRRLWRVAPAEAARARPVFTSLQGEPSADGEGLAVLVNPSSGPAWSADPTEALRDALPAARVETLDGEGTLADHYAAIAREVELKAIGIAGGDGTVNAAAEEALRLGRPLLVVPAGTLNHFARDLGVETVGDAVEAVHRGELVAVDVGVIDGRPFLNTASFGSYAALVDAREALESRIGKWPAVVVALVKVLRHERPADVEIDGHPFRVWMIFIGNCRYEPEGLAPTWRDRLDDGLLDVRLVDGSAPFSRMRLVVALLTGRLTRCSAYRRMVVPSLRIVSRTGPLRLARDGETFDGGADVEVAKHPSRLHVLRPRGVAGG